jgi:hypothetical protein
LRRRSGQPLPALRPPLGESPVCGSTGFGGFPTAGFRRALGIRRLWTGAPRLAGRSVVANLMRRSEGLGCVSCDGSDGKGLSGSAPTLAAHNTCFTRRGASRRWPPRASQHRLWERRWKRLRRPDGRLSALREAINVMCNGSALRARDTAHGIRVSSTARIFSSQHDPHGRIRPARVRPAPCGV